MTKKVILDEDGGVDALQAAAVLLSSQEVELVGMTSIFGNTNHDQALVNNGRILHFLGASHIPYYPGARKPSDSLMLDGDGAHGSDGLGDVTLEPSHIPSRTASAVDFIIDTLEREPEKTVTIIAAGPQTNIAQAVRKAPQVMRRVSQIIIMGGCTENMPAADMPSRRGNITPHAEFNFYMAARDARAVLSSELPIVLFPMNCTHQMAFSPERVKILKEALNGHEKTAETLIKMLNAPENIDRKKFNSPPVLHDVHTAIYLHSPCFYQGRRGRVTVRVDGEERGRTDFTPNSEGNVFVVEKIIDPDKAFNHTVQSLVQRLTTKVAH